ncbi:Late embryogenesis abundant (LEA) hydroxyproline-rich glycoprotein family [Zea mays]|uniref:Late embryogenesis abundant (LEA) hydroxyproline-rich glycoprotein family n=1 Tax=Zea mays TaxID=4577 RepID=A0A1D6JZH0_MAIZE|nr:Late embryogenesis abundant (LEA) hydroxyproline-rich glycoprotein family [Zea mays]
MLIPAYSRCNTAPASQPRPPARRDSRDPPAHRIPRRELPTRPPQSPPRTPHPPSTIPACHVRNSSPRPAKQFGAGAAVALAAALVGILACLVLGLKPPAYAVQVLAIFSLGNASSSAALSPGFDATVRTDNRNDRLGVRYEGGRGRVSVSYGGALLADDARPALYQAPRNVTVVVARARGSGVRLSRSVREQLAAAERLRLVSFDVDVDVPVRLQLGEVRTWAVPLRACCTVAVDRLAVDARVVSSSCDVKPPSIVTDVDCTTCDSKRPGKNCLIKLEWVCDYYHIKRQIESELIQSGGIASSKPFLDLSKP